MAFLCDKTYLIFKYEHADLISTHDPITMPTNRSRTTKTNSMWSLIKGQYHYIVTTQNAIRRWLLIGAYGCLVAPVVTGPLVAATWFIGSHFIVDGINQHLSFMPQIFGYIRASAEASRWPALDRAVLSIDFSLGLAAAIFYAVENIAFSMFIDFNGTSARLNNYMTTLLRTKSRGFMMAAYSFGAFMLFIGILLDLIGKGPLTGGASTYAQITRGTTAVSLVERPAQSNIIFMLLVAAANSALPFLYVALSWRLPLFVAFLMKDN